MVSLTNIFNHKSSSSKTRSRSPTPTKRSKSKVHSKANTSVDHDLQNLPEHHKYHDPLPASLSKGTSPVKSDSVRKVSAGERNRHETSSGFFSGSFQGATARAGPSKQTTSGQSLGKPDSRDQRGYDCNSHPLNLPSDELRRLSAVLTSAAMADSPMPMDLDDEHTNPSATGPPPPSPPRESPQELSPKSPGPFPPGNKPTVNGGVHKESSPTPPLDKVASPPTVPTIPLMDPEAAKAAGNRHFKAKEYTQAIKEYTKGRSSKLIHPRMWEADNADQSKLLKALLTLQSIDPIAPPLTSPPTNTRKLSKMPKLPTSSKRPTQRPYSG